LAIFLILFYAVWLTIVIVYTVAFAILLSAPAGSRSESENEFFPTVSLVIPTYNEGQIIGQKLENILELDYPRDKLDVLVVDSASSDDTKDTVRRFANRTHGLVNINLIEQPSRQGKSSAINEALRSSSAEVFALTDADVVVRPDALKRLVKRLAQGTTGAASGVEVPVGGRGLLFQIESGYRSVYTAVRMAEASLDTPFMCESEFSVYAKDSIQLLKPGCMCDDLELTVMVRSHNRKGAYVLGVPFFEQEANRLRPKLLHKYRRSMANQHGIVRNRRVLLDKTFGKYGTLIFPFEFFVNVISPLLVVAASGLFIGSILASPFDAPIEALVVLLSGVPSLLLLRQLTRKHLTPEILKDQRRLSWLLGTVAFFGFQLVLAVSLVRLGLWGPKLQWSQISETRVPIQNEIQIQSK